MNARYDCSSAFEAIWCDADKKYSWELAYKISIWNYVCIPTSQNNFFKSSLTRPQTHNTTQTYADRAQLKYTPPPSFPATPFTVCIKNILWRLENGL